MKGYYITEEYAKQLGWLDNQEIQKVLQKTLIAITINDLLDYDIDIENKSEIIKEHSNWFYEKYFETIIEGYKNAIEYVKI